MGTIIRGIPGGFSGKAGTVIVLKKPSENRVSPHCKLLPRDRPGGSFYIDFPQMNADRIAQISQIACMQISGISGKICGISGNIQKKEKQSESGSPLSLCFSFSF